MKDKIKILFYNRDSAGVNYYRTQTPAMQLQRDYPDKFEVEINSTIDFSDFDKTIEYLASFDIIHYHKKIVDTVMGQRKLVERLKKEGVTIVVDIDDYWELHKTHLLYGKFKKEKRDKEILANLELADYVTTTTEVFAKELRAKLNKDNVFVLPNSIDPEWMDQFVDRRKPSEDGKVRITYMAGSSHKYDLEQLEGTVNLLNGDPQTRGKFKIIVAGWDIEGRTTKYTFNEDLHKELIDRGLWGKNIVKEINRADGNVNMVPSMPNDLKTKYSGNMIEKNEESIRPEESVYNVYERILTDNYKIIDDEKHIKHLGDYSKEKYENEVTYSRRWTQPANKFAKVLDETDISIAPLADHKFNNMKSNLKVVECWSRKIPVVVSDIEPYNVDVVNWEECVLIPNKKRNYSDWYKALKKLILDEELRNKIGTNLYNLYSEKYNLKNVTAKRADYYEHMVKIKTEELEKIEQ